MSIDPLWTIAVWPRWLTFSLGAVSLAVVLVVIRFRYGSIVQPIRDKLIYRLLLASIGGWLAAWFLLPFSFLPVPATSGFFVPGALFGAFVIVPILSKSTKLPVRAALVVWAGTVAYAAIWLSGMVIVELLDQIVPHLSSPPDAKSEISAGAIEASLLGVPTGILFGVIVNLALSRILGNPFRQQRWIRTILISAICGTAYGAAVLNVWPEWFDVLERFTFDDFPIFITHALWYASFAMIFNGDRRREAPSIRAADPLLIGGLAALTILVGWSLGLEHYPYEWIR